MRLRKLRCPVNFAVFSPASFIGVATGLSITNCSVLLTFDLALLSFLRDGVTFARNSALSISTFEAGVALPKDRWPRVTGVLSLALFVGIGGGGKGDLKLLWRTKSSFTGTVGDGILAVALGLDRSKTLELLDLCEPILSTLALVDDKDVVTDLVDWIFIKLAAKHTKAD